MAKHTVDQWKMDDAVQLSNVRGYAMTEKLPKTLKEAYPNLKPFKFGFSTLSSLSDWYPEGWAHLTTDDFPDEDREALNQALADKGAWTERTGTGPKVTGNLSDTVRFRFSIMADPQGRIKYKENFVMIQPLEFFAKRRAALNELSEKQFKAQSGKEEITPEGGVSKSEIEEKKVYGKRGPKPKET